VHLFLSEAKTFFRKSQIQFQDLRMPDENIPLVKIVELKDYSPNCWTGALKMTLKEAAKQYRAKKFAR
jgi:hypothetical protein